MQYLFTWGGLPIGLGVLAARRFRLEKTWKGTLYGLTVGVLSAVGQFALFAAYRNGSNAAIVTVTTSLYLLLTVLLVIVLLREKLTHAQVIGLGFATVAFIIFSL